MRARRVFVCAYTRRRHPGTRVDPPGSDKRRLHCGWPGGSRRTSLSLPALRRNCACPRGSVAGICPRFTPVFFPLSGKKRRLAVSYVPVPPGRDRHSRVLAVSARLSAFVGSLRVWPFLYGDLDGVTGVRGHGNGERGWRRGLCALLRKRFGLAMLSAGSTLGLNVEAALRPPQIAPKSLRLSGLSSGAGRVRECISRGGVGLVRIRRPSPGYTERPARL